MNLVNEEHFVLLEIREECRQVTRLLQHRPGGPPNLDTQLLPNDVGQGGLSETRRPVQQDVVQRFVTIASSGDRDRQVLPELCPVRCSRRTCADANQPRTGPLPLSVRS